MNGSRERIRGPPRDGREGLTSAKQVQRRLMLLFEGRQYREAAGIISRCGISVLKSIVSDLPMDLLIEALPLSASLLEVIFFRLNGMDQHSIRPDMPVEQIIWHLVKLFGFSAQETGIRQRCTKLVQALGIWQPDIRDVLLDKRKMHDLAVQGLGIHGLRSDPSGALAPLHGVLKTELQRHVDVYKTVLHKIEELSLVTMNPDVAHSSHQRLLSISQANIQQRLIDNKTLLTSLDKSELKQLSELVQSLNERVQNDKRILFCVGEIRRIDANLVNNNQSAAQLLMNFSLGCEIVLCIMGLYRTIPAITGSCYCSDGYHSDSTDSSSNSIESSRSEVVYNFISLYTKVRTDTLFGLDQLPQLQNAHSLLKTKILFSIIVLAFRSCTTLRDKKMVELRRLFNPTTTDPITRTKGSPGKGDFFANVEKAARQYLQETSDTFSLEDVAAQVSNQVLSTLHEFPCLETCEALKSYLKLSVRLAWQMVNNNPAYHLDNDLKLGHFFPDRHERHPSSDPRSNFIREFVWPGLMQNDESVLKAIVST